MLNIGLQSWIKHKINKFNIPFFGCRMTTNSKQFSWGGKKITILRCGQWIKMKEESNIYSKCLERQNIFEETEAD